MIEELNKLSLKYNQEYKFINLLYRIGLYYRRKKEAIEIIDRVLREI